MSKGRKVRVSFQKNREKRRRDGDLTRQYREDEQNAELADYAERVRAKGGISRKRTVYLDDQTDALATGGSGCLRGRVLISWGLYCVVVTDDGNSHKCYTRRLLKSLATEERGVVTTGDWVWFRPAPEQEGLIVSVEPRKSVLTRSYRGREQVIAANVDQVLIVSSLVEPEVKPNLIDRYLVSAEQGGLRPVICFNKADLVEGSLAQPLVGLYSQLGYPVLLCSAQSREGIGELRAQLAGRETVIVGQSGVGKSSLLNVLEPSFHLKVGEISSASNKGRHTTTTARLLELTGGGSVIDTAGIRQFGLWDLGQGKIDGYFPEMRPFAAHCRYPGCTHTHEDLCEVKSAVSDGYVSLGRYESYCKVLAGDAIG